jgi:hypothetical protein
VTLLQLAQIYDYRKWRNEAMNTKTLGLAFGATAAIAIVVVVTMACSVRSTIPNGSTPEQDQPRFVAVHDGSTTYIWEFASPSEIVGLTIFNANADGNITKRVAKPRAANVEPGK